MYLMLRQDPRLCEKEYTNNVIIIINEKCQMDPTLFIGLLKVFGPYDIEIHVYLTGCIFIYLTTSATVDR